MKCGRVVGIRYKKLKGLPKSTAALVVYGLATRKGDSGAPVWHPRNKRAIAVGIVSGGYDQGKKSFVQPLLNTPNGHGLVIPGALNDPQIGNLHIAVVK